MKCGDIYGVLLIYLIYQDVSSYKEHGGIGIHSFI